MTLAPTRTVQNVLLVDDEPDIRTIGKLGLERVGKLTVTLATSGPDAIAKATASVPDVILLDVMMPELDGPSTLAQLRAIPALAAVPVIFLTAKVQPKERGRYLELGAAGVIAKPFDPMTLADEVRAIVSAG
jgi:two-component system OmpR family response regulator